MSAKTMAEVLNEHAFHMINPVDIDDVNGPWQVECNCTATPLQGQSYLEAEEAFAAHQAMELANAGFGDVRAARAGALDDAAEEIDRLRVIGKTPYSECTEYEARAWWAFAEVKPEAWLRTRAVDVRGDS